MQIKVLGTGCANCSATARLIEEVAEALNVPVSVEKVEDIAQIMRYGVMSTPGVVIDDQVVHYGSVPDRALIMQWLQG
ncbi:MAG TPA: thioredoxin family protein [Piscirickettsiaceae bacterium]|nr:thioredoxin family protein [Piscirickettsiaceae bacterium]HIQ40030.1 thioredoxin family protein [Sulfurivirga caldicuralii]